MSAQPPSPAFYAVVFRGGDVRFLPAYHALSIIREKAAGNITLVLTGEYACVMDLPAVERVEPFQVWREAAAIRLATSRRRICPYGMVHDEDSECRCARVLRMPLLECTARSLLAAAEAYAARSSDQLDDCAWSPIPAMIAAGYVHDVAHAYGLPISLPSPTHGTKKN